MSVAYVGLSKLVPKQSIYRVGTENNLILYCPVITKFSQMQRRQSIVLDEYISFLLVNLELVTYSQQVLLSVKVESFQSYSRLYLYMWCF